MRWLNRKVFMKAIDFDEKEKEIKYTICDHIMTGLGAQQLIGNDWIFKSKKHIEEIIRSRTHRVGVSYEIPTEMSVFFEPSLLGIELFLWAYGRSDLGINKFLDKNNHFEILDGINIPNGYQSILKIPSMITDIRRKRRDKIPSDN